jgi:hypothetical protein
MISELRPIFYAGFGVFNYYIYMFVKSLDAQPKYCPQSWKTGNLRLLSQLGMGLALLNVLLPVNRTVYGIPFIGGFYGLFMLGTIAMETYSLIWLCQELGSRPKCETSRYKPLIGLMGSCSSLSTVSIIFLIAAGLLY